MDGLSSVAFKRQSPARKLQWRKENKERIKQRMPINQKISLTIAANIRSCLYGKKNGRHWETLVEYTLDDLMNHLEDNFTTGMSWQNYGKFGWHIDHKKPISSFNFTTTDEEDFRRCWHFLIFNRCGRKTIS